MPKMHSSAHLSVRFSAQASWHKTLLVLTPLVLLTTSCSAYRYEPQITETPRKEYNYSPYLKSLLPFREEPRREPTEKNKEKDEVNWPEPVHRKLDQLRVKLA